MNCGNSVFTVFSAVLFAAGISVSIAADSITTSKAAVESHYKLGPRTADGIGKFFFGREIAHFMTHHGAPWLERPEREQEERPDLVIKALALKEGDRVADIGCGTGYFSWRMAQAVGNKGTVYGVEIQKEMLALLDQQMQKRGITNVKGVLGGTADPKLPVLVDLVIMVDVYHEFDQPFEMMQAICKQLKPGGRVVFVEYRGEDPEVPIKLLHKMTEAQVRKEMTSQPLEHVATIKTLPRQHIIIFKKKPDPARN